ncbi:vomeronasal type-2 receptor 26-like [Engystomops pustulosus]|uniref:vomeronasal type-2 receptor 26-like n=1 Tax=Engystomops pustulosus TaxID=76066 RepID=UPI003AFAB27B
MPRTSKSPYADNCIQCESDEWPNEERNRCLPKAIEFLSYQNDPMASVFSGLSLFGCLVTGSIFTIFISYQDTPIVKANNRNLSYLLLVSIFLSFLAVFLFLGRPSDVTCRLRETSFGVFFSVAVSSLLAKTVMVCVAFKSTKPGSPWRRWLSVKLPYTIVLLCSSIQVVICVIWLSISAPFQDLDTQSSPGKIIIQCNEGSDICFYSMLGYMGLLAAGSFLLAFMVRTLPDSFNEAKYITFSMLLSQLYGFLSGASPYQKEAIDIPTIPPDMEKKRITFRKKKKHFRDVHAGSKDGKVRCVSFMPEIKTIDNGNSNLSTNLDTNFSHEVQLTEYYRVV